MLAEGLLAGLGPRRHNDRGSAKYPHPITPLSICRHHHHHQRHRHHHHHKFGFSYHCVGHLICVFPFLWFLPFLLVFWIFFQVLSISPFFVYCLFSFLPCVLGFLCVCFAFFPCSFFLLFVFCLCVFLFFSLCFVFPLCDPSHVSVMSCGMRCLTHPQLLT